MPKRVRRSILIPSWFAMTLALLGLVFVIAKPLGRTDWAFYGVAIVVSLGFGLWSRRMYDTTVLERSERGMVFWWRRRSFGGPVPTIAPIASSPRSPPREPTP